MYIPIKKCSITIASLNLWRFYDWEIRMPTILSVLKELRPDILFTQETQRNLAVSSMNQIEILNERLSYPFHQFVVADMKYEQKGVPLVVPVEHGLGILSRFPFVTEIIELIKAKNDKEKRIVLSAVFEREGKKHHFCNLHFSNSDTWAEDHLLETLDIFKHKKQCPLLMGDFNIFDLSKYESYYKEQYVSSAEKYQYISYPSEHATFDYVLLPHAYSFEQFQCRTEYLSDHCLIMTTIQW